MRRPLTITITTVLALGSAGCGSHFSGPLPADAPLSDRVDAPPLIAQLQSEAYSRSSRRTSFMLWDDQDPIRWTATLTPGPKAEAGCFREEETPCLYTITTGLATTGSRVTLYHRDGIGLGSVDNYVTFTVRAVDLGGQVTERSVRFLVF